MKTDAKRETVLKAIQIVDKRENYQIRLNRDDSKGKWYNFTFKSDSGIPGARTSQSGRNLACASWHAHGYIFDEIFNIEPEAVIYSGGEKLLKILVIGKTEISVQLCNLAIFLKQVFYN